MTSKKNKRILLSGGSGMVGRNMKESLIAEKFDLISPPREEMNLIDYESTLNFIKKVKPWMVIHAAGKVGGINANIESHFNFYYENIILGNNLLLASKNLKVQKLINLGSSCMYPAYIKNPLKEDYLLSGSLEPTNEGYALAKLAVAKFSQYISESGKNFNYKTIIPCNLYGKFDKFDLDNSHLIPAAILKIHKAKERNDSEIEMWGDGSAKREFMYVKDLIDFIYYAIINFDKLPQFINVGTKKDYSVEEYYKLISKIIGFKGKIIKNTNKPTGMMRKKVSTTLQRKFGWESKINLSTGLKLTYEYFLDNN
tara:strand:+ start:315 stop:1250 length:936 start_codon:yes stop_codon:yes gene_type:complete